MGPGSNLIKNNTKCTSTQNNITTQQYTRTRRLPKYKVSSSMQSLSVERPCVYSAKWWAVY